MIKKETNMTLATLSNADLLSDLNRYRQDLAYYKRTPRDFGQAQRVKGLIIEILAELTLRNAAKKAVDK